jgi:pimeloyl-ACP methyl ester carboxylesterase
MELEYILSGLFLLITFSYWVLLIKTCFLSTRYYLQLAFLFGSGVSGLLFLNQYLPKLDGFTIWIGILTSLVFLLTAISLVLGLIKLFYLPGDRIRSIKSLERSFARFNSPNKRVQLVTEDYVRIETVHLVGDTQRKKVVIVCHGGARNKDIYASVTTCEYLFQDYDVITFDFRGHHESGGKWSGDGSTHLDVKAVIAYARGQGYQKIGVVGWSFGAWAAVIAAAEFHGIESLVAAAPPPTGFQDVKLTESLFRWGFKSWAYPFRVLVRFFRGLNIGRPAAYPSLMDYVGKVSPIPMLIACNTYDRVIGIPEADFRELYNNANEPKEFFVIDGTGHIYDWPKTVDYLQRVRDWFAETL